MKKAGFPDSYNSTQVAAQPGYPDGYNVFTGKTKYSEWLFVATVKSVPTTTIRQKASHSNTSRINFESMTSSLIRTMTSLHPERKLATSPRSSNTMQN